MFKLSDYFIELENSSPTSTLTGFLYSYPELDLIGGELSDIFQPDDLADLVFRLLSQCDLKKYKLSFNGKPTFLFKGVYEELYSQLFDHCISHTVGPTPTFADVVPREWEIEDYSEFFSSLRKLCQPVTVNVAPYLKLTKGKSVRTFEGEILLTILPFDKLAQYSIDVYLESFVSNYAESISKIVDDETLAIIVKHMKSEEYIGMIHFTSDSSLNHVKNTAHKCINLFEDLRKNSHEI